MGLFNKMTFWDALQLLDCEILSEHQKKKIIKAEAHFTDEEKTACTVLMSLHKGVQGVGTAVYLIDRASKDDICGKIMAALFTSLAFRTFSAAHESDPADPDCIAYLALAYEYGFFGCKKDHARALEAVQPLRSSDASGALVRKALKDILSAGGSETLAGGYTESGASAGSASKDKAAGLSEAGSRQSGTISSTAASIALSGMSGAGAVSGAFSDSGKSDSGFSYASDKSASDKSEPQGEFKRIEIDGDLFEGYFLNGKKNGRGKYTWANGDVYDGMWKDGKRDGYGKRIFKDGEKYEGQWHDGKKHGRGTYTWADGTYYEGEFADGNFNGFGKKVYSSGDVYEGQWKDDKRTGHGTYTWTNGDTYEGELKDGKLCGRGKLIQYGKAGPDALNAGEVFIKYSYDGEWLDNREHGHGICREGKGTVAGMDKVYEGEWVNGKKCGRFVWHFLHRDGETGKSYIDFYEDGNLIETCIPYDESIKTVEDARRAKALADGKSSSTTPVYTNSSPAAAQDSADTAEDFEWEEFSSVGELHEKILRPELFRDPLDRYLLNSCMYLEPFVDEFHEEFAGGDYAETKEIIAEILGVESGELTESIELRIDFIRGFTEKEYLLAAMYSLVYDERTDLAPYLANLACYLWTDTGDGDYLDPLLDLFRLSGEYDDDDSTWLCAILRLQENGNINDPLKPNDDGSFDDQFAYFDDVFGDLLDKGYLPGSDGKMYLSDSDDNGGDETEESDTGDNVLIRYQNGDSYRGAAVGGVREGFGAYFFAGGGFYRGCFHAENFEGYGMLDEGNGRVYKGLWKDNKRCGYGEQTFESGSKYFGWWKDNVYHGFGRFVFASGSENVGEFKNGNENGIFLIKRDGEWYGYKWVDGEIIPSLDGALITYNDGSGYVGQTVTEHRRGLTVRIRQGYGEYRFPGNSRNGSTNIYQGQFSQDVPYGTGIRVDTTGEEPIILASDDFRGDSIPDGKCRAVRLTGVDSYKYALFYEGGYRDGEAFGSGMLYVAGDSENDHYRYRPYGLPIGSIVRCDHFDGGPTGAAIVTDEYGEMRYGRFVDGFWEPNK